MTCGIYAIIGPLGKMYVGQSVNIEERFSAHMRCVRRKVRGYKKNFIDDFERFGRESFSLVILKECEETTLNENEENFLRILAPVYNTDYTVSGETECRRSEEARLRMSEAAKKRWSKESERKAQAVRAKGKHQSVETINKRVEKLTGQKRTEEQRRNISEAPRKPRAKGVSPSAETRKKLSEARKAYFAKMRSQRYEKET